MEGFCLLFICLASMIVNYYSDAVPFPDIKALAENGFMSQVEISGRPENYTIFVEEFYDAVKKVTKINLLNKGHRQTIIGYQKSNQVASIENGRCNITSFGEADSLINPLFPNWLYSKEGDSEIYYGPTSVLRAAADDPPRYEGKAFVRGIECHVYTGKDPVESDVNMKYSFTANWTTPINVSKSVLLPVRIQRFGEGVSLHDVSDEDFIQYVDYISFSPIVKDPRVFELPTGIGCKGLKSNDVKMPSIPQRFTVSGEQFIPSDTSPVMSVSTFRVWYDYSAKLARIDIYTKNDRGMSKVIDYNTGLMYVTSNNQECSALPISDEYFDAVTGDLKLVMKDPDTVMGMNGDFYYLGKKFTRGIYCDVWESVVETNTGRIVYTYYMSSHWWEFDVEGEIEEQVPIRLEINTYKDSKFPTTSVFNFFRFSKHPPLVYSQFSIENCANEVPAKTYISITMETDFDDAKAAIRHAAEIRIMAQEQIITTAGISPIRLPFLMVDFEPTSINIIAKILDRAPAIAQFVKLSDSDAPKTKETAVGNMKTEELCAEECVSVEICTGFHFCSKGECYISTTEWSSEWGDDVKGPTSCKLYQRHEIGTQSKDVLLKDALKNLDEAISNGKFYIEIADKEDAIKFTATDFTSDISPVTPGDYDRDMFSRMIRRKKFKDSTLSQTTQSVGQVLTPSECYRKCKAETNIACSSFSFCSDTNACQLSSVFVLPTNVNDLNAEFQDDPMCAVYSIEYLQMFEEYKGQLRVMPGKEAINADSAKECAKICREKDVKVCRGFDFCTSKKQCILHDKHVLDVKGDLTSVGTGCSHFALKYITDYQEIGRFVLIDPNAKSVVAVSVENCAKLCSENVDFKCKTFDYCLNDDIQKTKCILNTVTLDDAKSEESDQCQHYSKKNVIEDFSLERKVKSPPPDTSGYSPGGLTAIIFGVLICGIAVGIIGFLVYSYFRKSRLTDDRTVRFVRQENA